MQRQQHDGQPPAGEQFEMRQVIHPVRIEPERQSGDHTGHIAPGDLACQDVRPDRTERERQQEHRVVRENRASAKPEDWRRDRPQPDPMIGEGQAAVLRVERETVPPPANKGDVMGIPPEGPCAQDRVAGVVRKPARDVWHQCPEEDECDAAIDEEPDPKRAPVQVVRTTLPMFDRFWMKRCASAARSSGKVRATIGSRRPALELRHHQVHQRLQLRGARPTGGRRSGRRRRGCG